MLNKAVITLCSIFILIILPLYSLYLYVFNVENTREVFVLHKDNFDILKMEEMMVEGFPDLPSSFKELYTIWFYFIPYVLVSFDHYNGEQYFEDVEYLFSIKK
tara:strand:+ start:617 stop:925 length:309 start_codon:yes stop_codon:yes gene_type:complete